jgi:hypothetical protein
MFNFSQTSAISEYVRVLKSFARGPLFPEISYFFFANSGKSSHSPLLGWGAFSNCLNCSCQMFDLIKSFSIHFFMIRGNKKKSQEARSRPYGRGEEVLLVRYEDTQLQYVAQHCMMSRDQFCAEFVPNFVG